MTLAQVQPFVAAQIAAAPALAALGAAIQYSLLDDEAAVSAAIDTALRTKGVTYVIDPPYAESGQTTRHGATLLALVLELKVAESPTVTHSPSGLALVSALIAAITARSSLQTFVSCTGYDAAVAENGHVLHVVEFRLGEISP